MHLSRPCCHVIHETVSSLLGPDGGWTVGVDSGES